MWMRFGGDGVGVYLVGSATSSPYPRDCDISIVVPPALFSRRYGDLEGSESWEGSKAQRRMMREVGKQVMRLSIVLDSLLPPDLKVMSSYHAETHHRGRPFIRLDSFAEYDDHAYSHYADRPSWANPRESPHA